MTMDTQTTGKLTRKGEQTQQRILETALQLFTEKGYEHTTMREIAASAECSLGLTYRYFASKEDLVLALYLQLAHDLEAQVQVLPKGSIADRFEWIMRNKLARLVPYRTAFGALFGAALTPQSDVAVLGSRTSEIRERVSNIFLQVVTGASDAPRPQQARDLGMVLYAAHLLLILFWLHDRSPESRATDELLTLSRDMLARIRPILRLPPIAKTLARFAQAIRPTFGPAQ